MRRDRRCRRYGIIPSRLGPSTILREFSIEGTSFMCFRNLREDNFTDTNTTFAQPDPFGIDDYYVPYSLNKRKRWTLPEKIADQIEQLQDPLHNVRVSILTHEFDHAYRSTIKWAEYDLRFRYARSCHSVTSDGSVTHHVAPKGQQLMRKLVHPWAVEKYIWFIVEKRTPWNTCNDRWKPVNFEYRDRRMYARMDEEAVDQIVHVLYTVLEKATKPAAYTNIPVKKKAPKRDRMSRNHRKRKIEGMSDSEDEEEEDGEDDEEYNTPISCPATASSLASFIVSSSKTRNHPKRERKMRFEDEQFLSSTKRQNLIPIPEPTTWSWQEEEDDDEEIIEDVIFVESPPRIVLVTALPQLFTRIPLVQTALHDHPTLPVFPRSWEVHRQDTVRVLGCDFPVCIIAKEMNEGKIGLFAHENCLRCADTWGRIRPLFEDGDGPSQRETKSMSTSCGTCCMMTDESGLNEHAQPFSLSCGHTSCTGCWLRRVSDDMKRGEVPTTCPDPCCTLTLTITAAAALLDSASLRAYSDAVEEALLWQQKIARCSWCSRLRRFDSSRPFIRCECGCVVCARCSSPAHLPVSCETYHEYYRFIDLYGMGTYAFWHCVPSFIKKRPLELAFDARLAYNEHQKELDSRLRCLSIRSRKEFRNVFAALAHLAQMCCLNSGKSRRYLVLAQRIQFAMHYFFDTKDRSRRNLQRKTEFMMLILKDIVYELFS